MEQQIPLPKQDYMVNISCMTYNHEVYIEEALKGFVMQKTNFPFCALVIDDASTDGTAEIIRQYEQKYPEIIKGVYLTENHYSIKKSKIPYYRPWRERSKYIAICEGDDYWTDPLKLQKQVDFLEAHPDYVMCSHYNHDYIQEKEELVLCKDDVISVQYDLDFLVKGGWCFQPLTVMFRSEALNIEEYNSYKYSMDAVLFYNILKKGKGTCLPEIMAVYRRHVNGVWGRVDFSQQWIMEFKARFAIYQIEHTRHAARFILSEMIKVDSRMWLLKHLKITLKAYCIIQRHFGTKCALKLLKNKLIKHGI